MLRGCLIVALLSIALVAACGTDASAPQASDALVQDDQLVPVTDDLVAVFQSELGGGSWPSLLYFFDEILPSITS